jgi:hypothetical protein
MQIILRAMPPAPAWQVLSDWGDAPFLRLVSLITRRIMREEYG